MLTGRGVQRLPEDAGRAARPRRLHPRHHRPAEDPGHRAVALPALRLPADRRPSCSRRALERDPRARKGVPFEPGALPVIVRARRGQPARRALAARHRDRLRRRASSTRRDRRQAARLLAAGRTCAPSSRALLGRDGAAGAGGDRPRGRADGEDLGALCREVIELLRRRARAARRRRPRSSPTCRTPRPTSCARSRSAASLDDLIYVLRAFLDADEAMRRIAAPAGRARDRRGARHAPPGAARRRGDSQARRGSGGTAAPMPTSTGGAATPPGGGAGELLDAGRAGATPPPRAAAAPPPIAVSAQRGDLRDRPGPRGGAAAPASAPAAPSHRRGACGSRDEPLVEPAAADIEAAEHAGLRSGDPRGARGHDLMKRKALLGSVLQHATPLARGGRRASSRCRQCASTARCVEPTRQPRADQQGGAAPRRGGARGSSSIRGVAPRRRRGRNHPAVQAALSAFQGEVVAVRPATPEEGEGR